MPLWTLWATKTSLSLEDILVAMEEALIEILAALKEGTQQLDDAWLDRLVRRHNRMSKDPARTVAKRRLLPYYLGVRKNDQSRWRSWEVDPVTEEKLLRLLKMKPRRTASGVATITVITKPWPCSSDCLYCPNDIRMPKSYLANEPACQRAEHNYFDPYLQVKARLHALEEMGHVTDKVELIVLGGTWSDYPEDYQRWFIRELFRAVNDEEPYAGGPELPSDTNVCGAVPARAALYQSCGISSDPDVLARESEDEQAQVSAGTRSYNQVVHRRMTTAPWANAARFQHATWDEVEAEHRINEQSRRRVVGLVVETRPDLITSSSARILRRLGCTKVQMGIQSLDDEILQVNHRQVTSEQIAHAFAVLRAYGFKTHIHFMLNLLRSTPDSDIKDYLQLVSDERFLPDEVKLYPCALVSSAHLTDAYESGAWRPYSEDELLDVLVADVLATPSFTRISRMIRDISAPDILVGNKKTNLRQLVERKLEARRQEVREIRMREIATNDVAREDLRLECLSYTTATTEERFLQWVTEEGRIAGFCRLSLPDAEALLSLFGEDEPPTPPHTAMIREVHVYGRVAELGASSHGAAQHSGLGKALVEEACRLAREAHYQQVAVISAVGTRPYYRNLDFQDAALYQIRKL